MTMTIETKIKINKEKAISDMICLTDGKVIVVEHLGTVNLLTHNGKLEKQLTISREDCSATLINGDTIAITYPNEKVIKIFNIVNETVKKVITLNKKALGLSFSNSYLVVGLSNKKIRFINLEGNTLKSIEVQSKSSLKHLVYCNDRVIYSDFKSKAVYCVEGSGKQIWKYTEYLSSPRGLCTDPYGNIIVADEETDRIIAISKDGQDSKVLISKEDGLEYPWCICFKDNKSSVYICEYDGNYLAKFNLTSG